ncbi:hypothetical protein KAR91_61630 [Candidatus Pacearchaeota archaeon]|nr:hypothetical protein [Candidatus Pacearchaeota archaeon]
MIKDNRGDASFVIVVIVILVLGGAAIAFKNIPKDVLNEDPGWEKVNNVFSEYDNIEYDESGEPIGIDVAFALDSIDGGSGGSEGGGGGGTEEENCFFRPAMYSLYTVSKNESCLAYDGEICISKYVSCLSRLDNEGGSFSEFNTEFVIVPDGMNKSLYAGVAGDYLLAAGERYEVEESVQFDSVGEDGDANREASCFLNVLNIPQERVCF